MDESRFRLTVLAGCLVVVAVAVWLVARGRISAQPPAPAVVAQAATERGPAATAEPSVVLIGSDKCVDCHRAEFRSWADSVHVTTAFRRLREEKGIEYGAKLDYSPEQLVRDSVCLKCHGTAGEDFWHQRRVVASVDCEACHGPSGGWLNAHAVYGPNGTPREAETAEHYAQRRVQCDAAGQLGTENSYLLVRRCFECHRVGETKVLEANHLYGTDGFKDFLTELKADTIRHNFHQDQTSNAEFSTLWASNPRTTQTRNDETRGRQLQWLGALAEVDVLLEHMGMAGSIDSQLYGLASEKLKVFEAVLDAKKLLDEGEVVLRGDLVAAAPELVKALEQARVIYEKFALEGLKDEDLELAGAASQQLRAAAIKFAREVDPAKLPAFPE